MPDGFGGLGLAWNVARDVVPDSEPGFFDRGSRSKVKTDGAPDQHAFSGSFWNRDRCSYQGCGGPRSAHVDEV